MEQLMITFAFKLETKPENTVLSLALLSDSPRPAGRNFPTFPRNPAEAAIA
jgi:hypothetical protein